MDFKQRLQRWFKPRFAIIYPFGFFVLFCGYLDEKSMRAGIGFIMAGLLFRLWSNGYAIKNDKLTTCGPYAFVRHPLYLGTFLITIGFILALNMGWMGLLFLTALSFMYYPTIKGEQNMLLAKFAKAYQDYCAKVPAIIPTLKPYHASEQWPFSLERLMQSKEYKSLFWITILLIFFHLKTRLVLDHKPMTPETWGLVYLTILLIVIDIFFEINKKRNK